MNSKNSIILIIKCSFSERKNEKNFSFYHYFDVFSHDTIYRK